MELYLTLACAVLLLVCIALLIVLIKKSGDKKDGGISEELRQSRLETYNVIHNSSEAQARTISEMKNSVNESLKVSQDNTKAMTELIDRRMTELRESLDRRFQSLEEKNEKKLSEMKQVVDEKLQSTLEERISRSFKEVSERLEQVYKGLGEMQTLATGVGDLKKVLSGVKTRGILGEIQLGAILEQMLSPEQYEKNTVTVKGTSNPVEYAVKLPGANDGERVLLPIDSKFPSDAYVKLCDAYDGGNTDEIQAAQAELVQRIKGFAKDIHTKYISPPDTTEFAIMFLPTEGLYAEVVRLGLVEVLQADWRITVAGPTTMAALLNSLQMGFRTLAIQKRSGEVWKVLGEVKTEFSKFEEVLVTTQKRLDMAYRDLDKLVTTRTRAIQRKLRDVEALPDSDDSDTGYLTDGEDAE
ncbi:MAG: DNA recombination protein RmuC [Clostridia bacterium]|nr:DNA recombination protein RmuC [Clostridia bacterium]